MSWWDKYLAPGDIRHSQPISLSTPPEAPVKQEERSPLAPRFTERASASTRQLRQDALLYGGLAFTLLSAVVTRRSLRRKALAAFPQAKPVIQPGTRTTKLELPQFTPSNTPPTVSGGIDAAEALGLATLSVFSVFMAGTGLFMKLNNIGDVEDLRDFVRAGVGYDVYGGNAHAEADKEIEAWMAEVLDRTKKEGGSELQKSVLEKMTELAEIDRKRLEETEKGKAGGSVSEEMKKSGK